jgi:outer membrane protein OmpA-like peptidoglycan-associated protein
MRTRTGWLIAASLWVSATAYAADDCAQGGQYLDQAKAQGKNWSAQVPLLKRAVAACPSYDAYQSLGVALGHSKNRRDWTEAADAFVKANARAPNAAARAETLYQYASLVNDDGDPQNAYPMIKKAQALDPSRKDIAHLAGSIQKEVDAPKKEQLTRAFGLSVYKPLTASTEGGGGGAAADVTGMGHHQNNLPIHFQFNSVEVIEGQAQIEILAESLADPANAGKEYVFIGHTDSRGDENYNRELSKRRADAVRAQVLDLQPSLKGRIEVAGKGSSEPIDSGTDAAAMRANRRLQVTDK